MDILRRFQDIFKGRAEPCDPVLAVENPYGVPAIEDLGTGLLPQTRFSTSGPHATGATRTARLPFRTKQSNPQLAVPVTG